MTHAQALEKAKRLARTNAPTVIFCIDESAWNDHQPIYVTDNSDGAPLEYREIFAAVTAAIDEHGKVILTID